jgi:hypothetical protein
MSLFALTKWYFDVLDREHNYLFFYLARARLAGRNQTHLHLNAARLGNPGFASVHVPLVEGKTAWGKDEVETEYGGVRWNADETTVRFAFRDVDVSLRYIRYGNDPSAESSLAIPGNRGGRIFWTPAAIRCAVDGVVRISDRRFSFQSRDGYYDRLESNVFPFFSPVRRLLWGRLHRGRLALTYTAAEGVHSSQKWSQAVLCDGKNRSVFEKIHVTVLEERFSEALQCNYPVRYDLKAENSDAILSLSAERIQEAIVSDFMEDQHMTNRVQALIYRRISRNPRGVKFFSKGSIRVTGEKFGHELTDVVFIDEFVRFGG